MCMPWFVHHPLKTSDVEEAKSAALALVRAKVIKVAFALDPPGFSVDDLAQEIRRVDGENELGAGTLAEHIMAFIESSKP